MDPDNQKKCEALSKTNPNTFCQNANSNMVSVYEQNYPLHLNIPNHNSVFTGSVDNCTRYEEHKNTLDCSTLEKKQDSRAVNPMPSMYTKKEQESANSFGNPQTNQFSLHSNHISSDEYLTSCHKVQHPYVNPSSVMKTKKCETDAESNMHHKNSLFSSKTSTTLPSATVAKKEGKLQDVIINNLGTKVPSPLGSRSMSPAIGPQSIPMPPRPPASGDNHSIRVLHPMAAQGSYQQPMPPPPHIAHSGVYHAKVGSCPPGSISPGNICHGGTGQPPGISYSTQYPSGYRPPSHISSYPVYSHPGHMNPSLNSNYEHCPSSVNNHNWPTSNLMSNPDAKNSSMINSVSGPPVSSRLPAPNAPHYLRQHLQQKMGFPSSPNPMVFNGSSVSSALASHDSMLPPQRPQQSVTPQTVSSQKTHQQSTGNPHLSAGSDSSVISMDNLHETLANNGMSPLPTGPDGTSLHDEASQHSTISNASQVSGEDRAGTPRKETGFSGKLTHAHMPQNTLTSGGNYPDEVDIANQSWTRVSSSPVYNCHMAPPEPYRLKKADALYRLYEMDESLERRAWLDRLLRFMEERGTAITACPTISKNPLDLHKLYLLVRDHGGFVEVSKNKTWKDIAGLMGIGASSSAAYTLRKHYTKNLLPFECRFDRGGVDPQPIITQFESSSKKKTSKTPIVQSPCSSNSQDGFPLANSNSSSMEGYPTPTAGPPYSLPPSIEYNVSSGHPQGENINVGNPFDDPYGNHPQCYSASVYPPQPSGMNASGYASYPPTCQADTYQNRPDFAGGAPTAQYASPSGFPNRSYPPSSATHSSATSEDSFNGRYATPFPARPGAPPYSASPTPPNYPSEHYNQGFQTTFPPKTHYAPSARPMQQYQNYGQQSVQSSVYNSWQGQQRPFVEQFGQQWPSPRTQEGIASQWGQRYPYPVQWSSGPAVPMRQVYPPRPANFPSKQQYPSVAVQPIASKANSAGFLAPQLSRKEMSFPPDSVEAMSPLLVKRRRLTRQDIQPVDAWRIMMALKSGLLAESTWALDVLNALLFDDSSVLYFGLANLPGLLDVLLEHFRRTLIEIFNIGDDLEADVACQAFQDPPLSAQWFERPLWNPPVPELGEALVIDPSDKQVYLFGPNYTWETRMGYNVGTCPCDDVLVIDGSAEWEDDLLIEPWLTGANASTRHIVTRFDSDWSRVPFVQMLSCDAEKSDASTTDMTDKSVSGTSSLKNVCAPSGLKVCDLSHTLCRKKQEEFEDECCSRDEPSLNPVTETKLGLIHRCLAVSNVLRSLSFLSANGLEMSKNAGLLLLLGKLLLLHHEHPVRTEQRRNYDREEESDWRESCSSLLGERQWWWDELHILRENSLVILANVASQLDLSSYSEEIARPILDGLLHWAVCPSAYGQDPFPYLPSHSVLSPQRLSLEALCKLCVQETNVDLVLATPPFERLEHLCGLLVKALCRTEDQVMREFAINLLHYFAAADPGVARCIALHHPCISLIVSFIEQAEQSALGIANTHGVHVLRENPDAMGTSLDMLRRAARILLHLAHVRENRLLYVQHEQRLLTLVMSQILDQHVAAILSRVLFEVSHANAGDVGSDS